MKGLNYLLLATLVLTSLSTRAQQWTRTGHGIKATIKGFDVSLDFYTPTTIRVLKSPTGTSFEKKSLSVIAQPETVPFRIRKETNTLTLETTGIRVVLDLQDGQVSTYSPKRLLLLAEQAAGTSFTPFNDAGDSTFTVEQKFNLDKNEAIYGLGQQQQGRMIQRNLTLNMVQGNTDDYIPFFQSVKGYGLFWDNYSPTTFTDSETTTLFRSVVGDCIDYYVMYGGNADGVVRNMRSLTGQAPLMPLWTFGYFQSKERYKSQDELLDVVKKYRELKVPLDGIIQDWQYWGNNYLWNAMEFLNTEFPNPKKMVDDIHQLDAHMLISIWNSFGPRTKQYKDLEAINALMDFRTWPESGSEKWPPRLDYPSGVRVYDAYNPKARDIFWNYLNDGIFKLGMDGWWLDSSEPDHLGQKPADMDNKTYLGSFRKVRNAYPLMTVGGIYDHQRAVSDSKRVFILTRSAFAGQQRYGANTWSGDVFTSWKALRNQISAGLNFSLTGIPYWNSDIGGFFLNAYLKKLADPEYRELYVRWLQFGTFCPMMRSHGADAPREIYQFGKDGDVAYDAIAKYIRLRYRMLPYIYSASWDVTANQSTMMRALVMDFPADTVALNLNDQFMFGKSIMVSPVTDPMYVKQVVNDRDTAMAEDFSKIRSKKSWLPAGSDWYDFWTNEFIHGGQAHTRETPIDLIPLYVKAGSIIPMGPEVQFATEKNWDTLDIHVYPGADGRFVLYEDEFDNYNYEKKFYSTIEFNWNDKSKTLTIGNRNGAFPGMLTARVFRIYFPKQDNPAATPQRAGRTAEARPSHVITYSGKKISLKGLKP